MTNQNGGKVIKRDKYITQIIEGSDHIYKFEAKLILRAFKKTIIRCFNEFIEFEISNFCRFFKYHRKERQLYVRYRGVYETIPEHDTMKFRVSDTLKAYLNHRGKFLNVWHRDHLPEGIDREIKF